MLGSRGQSGQLPPVGELGFNIAEHRVVAELSCSGREK